MDALPTQLLSWVGNPSTTRLLIRLVGNWIRIHSDRSKRRQALDLPLSLTQALLLCLLQMLCKWALRPTFLELHSSLALESTHFDLHRLAHRLAHPVFVGLSARLLITSGSNVLRPRLPIDCSRRSCNIWVRLGGRTGLLPVAPPQVRSNPTDGISLLLQLVLA